MTATAFKAHVRNHIGGSKTKEAIEALDNRFKEENNDEALNILTVIKGEYSDVSNDVLIGISEGKEARQALNSIHSRLLNLLDRIDDNSVGKPKEVIAACKAAKGLLMYLSENTNGKTVFYEDANKHYWLRKAQGQAFIDVLSEFSLVEGHGKHLPKAIKRDFYSFRGIVYKIIEKAKIEQDLSDEILITNVDIKAFVTAIRQQILDKLDPYL